MVGMQTPDSADPFAWYARLRAAGAPVRAAPDGPWLLARHAEVMAALCHPLLRVRPPGREAADWLGDGPAAGIFRNHVRMSDGAAHRDRRQRLEAALQVLPGMAWLRGTAAAEARRLLPAAGPLEAMSRFALPLPLGCVALWLGLPPERRDWIAARAAAFAPALLAASPPQAVAAAQAAAADLLHLLLPMAEAGSLPFLATLTGPTGPGRPLSPEEAAANAIGLLAQTCDATSGLVGNALRQILSRPALAAALREGGVTMTVVLAETMRFDPPVHLTRRVAEAPLEIGGAAIAAGEELVLLLASAGRDGAVYPDPDAFRPERYAAGAVAPPPGWGAGPHRCPGAAAAREIAGAALLELLRLRPALQPRQEAVRWRRLPNARIPETLWLEG